MQKIKINNYTRTNSSAVDGQMISGIVYSQYSVRYHCYASDGSQYEFDLFSVLISNP